MAHLDTLPRVTARVRSGHRTRELRLRQSDSAIVFTLPGGGTIEVDLAASPEGNLIIRNHQGRLELSENGSMVAMRPAVASGT